MKSAPITTAETIYSGDINAIRADASGAAALSCHQQLGTIALGTNASNTQTLTITVNGTAIVIHFVTAIGSTANNVLIGASAAATSANLLAFLQNPFLTNTTQVAATTANQTLLSFLTFSQNGTSTVLGSNNKSAYAPLTSLSCSTTVTSGTYTAATLKVYVEPGICYVNGVQVKFLGGSSPAVTAPASNPRIDVLTIDSSGTLAWTTGAENASPSAPTYPANKIPLCELYNVVSETILNDYENQASGTGYILNDVRPMVENAFNPASVATDLIPDADNTRALGSLSKEWTNGYFKNNVYVNGLGVAISKYGGTGTDGALSITSGTTTISAASAYVEKNYTSMSITSTGNLAITSAFYGTSVTLRSQGNVTITTSSTSAITVNGIGGGPDGWVNADSPSSSTAGIGGAGGGSTTGRGAGSASASTGNQIVVAGTGLGALSPFTRWAPPGGNGSNGTTGGANGFSQGGGGGGGNGGGGLYIECGGAYNFTTGALNAGGATGGAAPHNTSGGLQGGCGGGGAGGNIIVLYFSLTADSGTYNVSGGAGGTNGFGAASGAAGANGLSYRGVNNYHA